MARYGLIGKTVNNGNIIGYFIIDSSGKQMLISKDKTMQLARNQMITNWEAVLDDDNEYHLYNERLSIKDLPNMVKEDYDNLKPVAKLFKDNKVIGYSCIDNNGIKHNYSISKFWEFIKLGLVENVRAYKYGNRRVIISKDKYFEKLPNIETD